MGAILGLVVFVLDIIAIVDARYALTKENI
jgi:hypothetical protein